jgi:hypothetical protein
MEEILNNATPYQLCEARAWVLDCIESTSVIADDVTVSDARAVRYVMRNYPGGWEAFIAEHCPITVNLRKGEVIGYRIMPDDGRDVNGVFIIARPVYVTHIEGTPVNAYSTITQLPRGKRYPSVVHTHTPQDAVRIMREHMGTSYGHPMPAGRVIAVRTVPPSL